MIYFVGNYEVPNTIPATHKDLEDFLKGCTVLYIDSETRKKNLSPIKNDPYDNEMVMFQIGNKVDQYVIDTRTHSLLPIAKILQDPKILKVGHNIKFDYKVLKTNFGIVLENVFDTMIAEYLLSAALPTSKGYYSLEQTHLRYTGYNPYGEQLELFRPYIPKKTRNFMGSEGNFTEGEVAYGVSDIQALCRLLPHQIEKLYFYDMKPIMDIENEFVLTLGDMELAGMPINIDRWIELDEWAQLKMQEQLNILNIEISEVLNWNSSKQVETAFSKLGINTTTRDILKSRKLGEETTKKSVQELVIKEQAEQFPIINTYLKYKGFKKLLGTYGIPFLKNVSPITNRIHSDFFQILDTGRTASSSPNMQNIITGKEDFKEGTWWREAFEAPKGRKFIICDYTQQELHVLADRAQEESMLEVLRAKADIHSLNASKIYGVPVSKTVNSHLRPNGKKFAFSVAYGAGESKIAHEFKIPIYQAKKLLNSFFSAYPSLKAYFDKSFADTLKNGYVTIDTFGRKAFISTLPLIAELKRLERITENPKYKKQLKAELEQIRRYSQNYVIQGSSATMSKLAGNYLRKALKNTNARVLLLIHDEWVVECDDSDVQMVKEIVEDCMTRAALILCPSVQIPAEVIISQYWNK